MLFYSGVESKIYPTGILQGSEKCGKYFPDLKMLGKKKAEYGKVFVFPDFCPYLILLYNKLKSKYDNVFKVHFFIMQNCRL